MKLPSFQELSKEQDGVYTMPLEGNFLVTGPPGTGKTVMALYRAQALAIDDRESQILMHSKVLKQYASLAAKEVDALGSVHTFHSWFWAFWRKHYGRRVPKVDSDPWAFDWHAIAAHFSANPPPADTLSDLLIDEGQDLSPSFYQLVKMMSANTTVFADENQKLFPDNSTLEEIRRSLGRHTQVFELTRNYRNTKEIAQLAAWFYCGSPTGIPEPPDREGDVPVLRSHGSLNDFVDSTARYAKTYSDRMIGVVAPSKATQRRLFNRLSARDLPNPVQTYVSGSADHAEVDFSRPGIVVLNYWTIKGLEFDTLFVPELQQVTQDPTSAEARMRFYVVLSRARNELYLSYTGSEAEPRIVVDIPTELLERE